VVRVGPLADDVAAAIADHLDHPALKWPSPNQVRVTFSSIPELEEGPNQTRAGRRKRFTAALDAQLAPLGWTRLLSSSRLAYTRAPTGVDAGGR
jgi:hypothetical protein